MSIIVIHQNYFEAINKTNLFIHYIFLRKLRSRAGRLDNVHLWWTLGGSWTLADRGLTDNDSYFKLQQDSEASKLIHSSSMLWVMGVYHNLLQIVAIVIMIVSLLIISLCFSESLRCKLPTTLPRRQVKECNHRDCLRKIDSRGLSHVERKLTMVDDASDDLDSDAALMAKILAADDNNVFMRYSGHTNTVLLHDSQQLSGYCSIQ